MPSHNLTLSWNKLSDTINLTVTITDSLDTQLEETVADSTEPQFTLPIDVSVLSLLYIHSDEDVTIRTNANHLGAPDDSFVITADMPLVWYEGCGLPNPFASAVDVASIFVQNASGAAATVKIKVLQDSSP